MSGSQLTTGQGPGQSHEKVSQVVWVADHTPPARHEQTLPCSCGDGFQIWREEKTTKTEVVSEKDRKEKKKTKTGDQADIKYF